MVRADRSNVGLIATHSINSPLFSEETPAHFLPVVRNTMCF